MIDYIKQPLMKDTFIANNLAAKKKRRKCHWKEPPPQHSQQTPHVEKESFCHSRVGNYNHCKLKSKVDCHPMCETQYSYLFIYLCIF